MRISTVLFILGVLAMIGGGAVIGFGIPVSEFSFGNTLIVAGATAASGGLIVVALAAVVGKLQNLYDALVHMPAGEPVHAPYTPEPASPPAMAPAAAPPAPAPAATAAPVVAPAAAAATVLAPSAGPAALLSTAAAAPAAPAPKLRNPDEPVEVEDEVTLSPQPPAAAEPEDDEEPHEPRDEQPERRPMPAWLRPRPAEPPASEQRSSLFDSMWPPEDKMLNRGEPEAPAAEEEPAAREPEPVAAEAAPAAPPAAEPEPAPKPKPRAVAILKSGVVDGMGYTLYVDGSIEAEMPEGTLRFASIHELRAHLEQNG